MNKTWADFKVGASYRYYGWDTDEFVTVTTILGGIPIVFDEADIGTFIGLDYFGSPIDFTEVKTPREYWLVRLDETLSGVVFKTLSEAEKFGNYKTYPHKEIIHVKEVINGK